MFRQSFDLAGGVLSLLCSFFVRFYDESRPEVFVVQRAEVLELGGEFGEVFMS